jgi:hypothetical protein
VGEITKVYITSASLFSLNGKRVFRPKKEQKPKYHPVA